MWDLPGPGIEPVSPALAGALNHCATREAPKYFKNVLYLLLAAGNFTEVFEVGRVSTTTEFSLGILALPLPTGGRTSFLVLF